MALFKVYRGNAADLPQTLHDGYAYFVIDTGDFYIDAMTSSNTLQRTLINPKAKYFTSTDVTNNASTVIEKGQIIVLPDNTVKIGDGTSTLSELPAIGANGHGDLIGINGSTDSYSYALSDADNDDLWDNISDDFYDYWSDFDTGTQYIPGEEFNIYPENFSTESVMINGSTLSAYDFLRNAAKGSGSHAEGSQTIAEGVFSHSEGRCTIASGDYSHAEGGGSEARGDSSHAEGGGIAFGSQSHAEGFSLTSAIYAHAEGSMTTASGHYSHAECNGALASGNAAHAEGYFTTASGMYSHTQNEYTIAQKKSQTAIGKYNVADTVSGNYGKYALIIGNGTATNSRSNAMTVDWDGNVIANGFAKADGTPIMDTSSFATTAALGDYALKSTLSNYAPASTLSNYALLSTLDNYAPSSTLSNYALNSTLSNYAPSSTLSNYAPSSTLSNYAPSSTLSNYALNSTLSNYAPASTLSNFATTAMLSNYATTAAVASVFKYKGTKSTYQDVQAVTGMSVGDVWFVEADNSEYAYNGTVWEELGPTIDLSAYATTAALGDYALKSTLSNYALTSTLSNYAPASTLSNYAPSSTLSNYALNSTLSNYAPASTLSNYAPSSTLSNYAPSSTLSNYVTTTVLNSTLSNYALESTLSNYAPLSTLSNYATTASIPILGHGDLIGASDSTATAAGAEIFNIYVSASGIVKNVASGDYSHAQGEGTSATDYGAHAEGQLTLASGTDSHAQGFKTTASGNCSHAQGYITSASEIYSHTEGQQTSASGSGSHAEGGYTHATSAYTHAEGYYTRSTSTAAHAEGYYTTASGKYSHAQNQYTIAQKFAQTAIGKYNVADTVSGDYGKYALIIGNGTGSNARSNALTVDWDGNVTAYQYVDYDGCILGQRHVYNITLPTTTQAYSMIQDTADGNKEYYAIQVETIGLKDPYPIVTQASTASWIFAGQDRPFPTRAERNLFNNIVGFQVNTTYETITFYLEEIPTSSISLKVIAQTGHVVES